MKFSIVLSTHAASFGAATFQGDLDRNLARIAALGYQGVELAIRDPSLVDGPSLLDRVRRQGLQVSAIGTGQAWGEEGLSLTHEADGVRRRAAERVLAHLPFAREAGAVVILGLIRGVIGPGSNRDRATDRLREALHQVAARASSTGVRLALEPICRKETNLVNTVDEGIGLVEQVGHDSLGLLLDTYHMHQEESSIPDAIRRAGKKLFHFHVADSNRRHPGAGSLDFSAILETLRAVGYTGYVSGEFLPEPDVETAAARAISHLQAAAGGPA